MSRSGSDARRLAEVWQFDSQSCPLCRVAEEAEERFFFWFLRESHYSVPVLEHLDTSALCRRHAARLLRGDNQRLSATFEALGRKERVHLAELAESLRSERPGPVGRRERRGHGGGRSGPGRMAASLEARGGCLACEAAETAVQGETLSMVPVLGTADGRVSYRAGAGFCRAHLWLVLSRAPNETTVWLVADARRRLEELLAAFELYSHRLDHRFQHEAKGEEQDAWKQALRYFWRDPPSWASRDR